MKLNQKISISLWAILLLYLLVNVGLASWPTVKVLYEKNQHLSNDDYAQLMTDHQNHPITKIRKKMIPIWNYNNRIYPTLLSLAAFSMMYCKLINKKITEPPLSPSE